MKKNVFFVVAFATLAFVGCNKEEHNGKVALNVGAESYVNNTKIALKDNTQLLFTEGDKAYVNGELVNLSVRDGRTSAILWVSPSDDGCYAVNYPSNMVTIGTDGTVTTTFKDHVTLVPADNATNEMVMDNNQVWPMSGYANDVATQSFRLFNNVAVLSPAVKYGAAWARIMWEGENAIDYVPGFVADADNLPKLTITKIVFSSNSMALEGPAHLVGNNAVYNPLDDETEGSNGPRFVSDWTPTANNPSVVECEIVDGGIDATPNTSSSAGIVTLTFGNLAVPHCTAAGKDLTAHCYFTVTFSNNEVRRYDYYKTVTTGESFRLKRGHRATALFNFYTANDGNIQRL